MLERTRESRERYKARHKSRKRARGKQIKTRSSQDSQKVQHLKENQRPNTTPQIASTLLLSREDAHDLTDRWTSFSLSTGVSL